MVATPFLAALQQVRSCFVVTRFTPLPHAIPSRGISGSWLARRAAAPSGDRSREVRSWGDASPPNGVYLICLKKLNRLLYARRRMTPTAAPSQHASGPSCTTTRCTWFRVWGLGLPTPTVGACLFHSDASRRRAESLRVPRVRTSAAGSGMGRQLIKQPAQLHTALDNLFRLQTQPARSARLTGFSPVVPAAVC